MNDQGGLYRISTSIS